MIPLSILDTSPIREGHTVSHALASSLQLAVHAERLRYRRLWFTEHHNMPGMASAAPVLLAAHVARETRVIRVGAGGVMLPNHSPLVVAEQFGTLASMFPGRIDLGIGRASGGDRLATNALRRGRLPADRFNSDVEDVIGYLWQSSGVGGVHAIPGRNTKVPVWILGTSCRSALLAAELGRPFAFASHFRPNDLMAACDIYRTRFKPSEQLSAPYTMLSFNVIAAESDDDARLIASSMQRATLAIERGMPRPLQPPTRDYISSLATDERASLAKILRWAAIGSAATVRGALAEFIATTRPDEVIISSPAFDPADVVRSYEIVAGEFNTSALVTDEDSRGAMA